MEPSETETHTLMAEKENQNSKTNSSQSKHGGRNDKTDSLQTKRPLCKLDPALAEDTSDMDRLRIAQESLQFTKTEEDLQTLIDGLPDGKKYNWRLSSFYRVLCTEMFLSCDSVKSILFVCFKVRG